MFLDIKYDPLILHEADGEKLRKQESRREEKSELEAAIKGYETKVQLLLQNKRR